MDQTRSRPTAVGPTSAVPAIALATAALVTILVHLTSPSDLVGDVSYLAGTAGAAAVGAVALATRPTADRRSWGMVVAGIACSAVGDLVSEAYGWTGRVAPGFSAADPWWLLSYTCIGLGATRIFRARDAGRPVDVDAAIDTAVLAVVTGVGLWQLFLARAIDDPTVGLPTRIVTTAYPVLDAMLLLLVLRAIGRARTTTAPTRLLALGVACWLGSDVAYFVDAERDLSRYLDLMDAGWMLGAIAMAAAVWWQHDRPPAPGPEDRAHDPDIRMREVAWTVVPLFVPSLVDALARYWDVQPDPTLLVLETLVLGGLVLARATRLVRSRNAALARERDRERFYRTLAETSSDAVVVVDASRRVRHGSPNLHHLVGCPSADALGRDVVDVLRPSDPELLGDVVAKALLMPDEVHHLELALAGDDRTVRHLDGRAVNRIDDPAVGGVVITLHDATERRVAAEALRRQAFHDSLTGLANRALFRDRLEHALQRRARSGLDPAVIFLDVDGFKRVNDSMGHEAGDALLVTLAERISRSVRSDDTVARLGGDEFAILIEERVDAVAEAAAAADRIIASVSEPIDLGDRTISLSASLGIEVGDPLADASSVLRNADIAMYRAKAAGKGRWVVFDPSMRDHALEQVELEVALGSALERHELVLQYQPFVDLPSGTVTGFEALLRWEHPQHGTLLPEAFVPAAEETGLIVDIGAWVLHEACGTAGAWRRRHPERTDLTIAVNVSGVQLARPQIVDQVAEALVASGLDAHHLVLELTESVLVADPGRVARRLTDLRALGVRVALDDFGTGYSSLNHLRQFPVDILKIDRSFVGDISGDPDHELPALVRGLIDLGRTLDLEVVAEGIEEPGQLRRLRDGACRVGQGFLLARPLSALDAEQLLLGAALLGGLPRPSGAS
ncbi:MAG TPA: EAL domain-containing protein [Aquihabitans sp.]|jgi:diguanylate cyclase (GGDEF)-like protein/PAS domain S-box-containing protein|nr:EAL domain-containing protein [Aquihabitans sp.]